MLHTDVAVLNISSRSLLGFDNLVRLFDQMLNEHLGCDCDNEGCIVGAVLDFVIGVNDLLDASHWDR